MQHKQTSATEAHFETALAGYTRRARPARRGAGEIVGYTAAAGGLAFAGGDAMGAIVHNTTAQTFSVSDTYDIGYVDIDNDQNSDARLLLVASPRNTSFFHFYASFFYFKGFTGGAVLRDASNNALNLSKGAAVGKISSGSKQFGAALLAYQYFYVSSPSNSASLVSERANFVNTTGYIGFRFFDATPDLKYGWMKLRVDFDAQTPKATVTLYEWAYDDTGAAINVGDTGDGGGNSVASPATPLLTLLGLGAMGLTHYRRRRSDGLQQMVAQTGVAAEGASTAA